MERCKVGNEKLIVSVINPADSEGYTVEVTLRRGNGCTPEISSPLPVDVLLEAFRTVAAGKPWHPPAKRRMAADSGALSTCESSVVRLVALGMRNSEVALHRHITEGTVKSQLNSAFRKLGLRNRAELTLRAVSMGLVRPDELTTSAIHDVV